MKTHAELHNWNVICQICREKIKASDSVRRWDGYIVGRNHEGCYEEKHSALMPKPPRVPEVSVPFTSKDGTDNEVSITYNENRASTTIPSGTFQEDTL